MYTPILIPLNTVEKSIPTEASEVLSGTFTRQIGEIHTVDIITDNPEQGQISYLNIEKEK